MEEQTFLSGHLIGQRSVVLTGDEDVFFFGGLGAMEFCDYSCLVPGI